MSSLDAAAAIEALLVSRADTLEAWGGTGMLVLARVAGMMALLPGWQSGVFPFRLRCAAALVVTWLVVPVLGETALPEQVTQLVPIVMGEFLVGATVGSGVLLLFAAVRGAGEIVDRQTGWGLGAVMDPAGNGGGPGTMILVWSATAALFVMTPVNGHLLVLESFLESFESIRPGSIGMAEGVELSARLGDLVSRLVHQSLLLTIQVAAPMIAVMLLVSVVLGMVGRALPETNMLVGAMPARVLIGIALLAVVQSGLGRMMVDVVPGMLQGVSASLVSASEGG